jgi:hypothetical protein
LKSYAVFIRHFHSSTDVEDIQVSLFDIGHEVIRVSNILHCTTKRPWPLFWIDLKVADSNYDILKLDLVLNTRIKIELPRNKLSPPQCHDCQSCLDYSQAYYHTSNFLHQSPRCVKYGENHYTSDCTKSPSEPVKCALCSRPHTALYKGYPVFKKLSENFRKSPSLKTYCFSVLNHTIPSINKITSSSNQKQKRLYANVTANTSPLTATPESLIFKFLEDLKALINP